MIRVLRLLPVVMLAACATVPPPPPPPPPLQTIVPPGTEGAAEMFGFSPAVRAGDYVFVSGQVGFDTAKFGFPEGFGDQVRLAFANLEKVLKASGASLRDVVSMTTYQLDMERFNDVIDIRNEVFGDHRPAWTPVGVKALALPSIQFTVTVVAYAPIAPAAGRPATTLGSRMPADRTPPAAGREAPVVGGQRPGY